MKPLTLFGCALLATGPGSGLSAEGRGALGAQSRATIRISLSVAPRFALASGGAKASAQATEGPALFSSNAPGLRYALVRQARGPGEAGPGAKAGVEPLAASLWLVTPD
jgi:hypothetical protein